MRILHISDLHFEEELGIATSRIKDRFCSFIGENLKAFPIDVIVITGDLRTSPGDTSVDTVKVNLEEIADSVGVFDKKRILIIPGNHDLSRGKTEEDIKQNDNFVRDVRKKYNVKQGTFKNKGKDMPKMLSRFDEFFFPLCDAFYGKANPFVKGNPHYICELDGFTFICLNSCLTCLNSSSDGDLRIGLNDLKALVERASEAKNIIILSHHPIQNINSDEEIGLKTLFSSYKKNFVWLCGDTHQKYNENRDYIHQFQVGGLFGTAGDSVPDFAIYEFGKPFDEFEITRKVFVFSDHLNYSSPLPGGWKRVYV
jgi:3',5'-cyclic AMP phosphodiesterase CpdA